MYLLDFSKRVSDFIDAADVGGNLKNSNVNINYLNIIDQACSKAGISSGAVYPVVGNNGTTHSFNFLNPSQFQLSYNGTITHSASGFKTNGLVSSYIDLNYNMQSNAVANNISMGVYVTVIGNAGSIQADFGVDFQNASGNTGINRYVIASNISAGSGTNMVLGNQVSIVSRALLNQKGMFACSRVASNNLDGVINDVYINNTTLSNAVTMPNYSPVLGAIRYNDGIANMTNATFGFAYITTGISAQSLKIFSYDISYAQSILTRR